MDEVKRLLKSCEEVVSMAGIEGEDKTLVENITRLDFLTGAHSMCIILEKENIAKELTTIINKISEEII